jgi:capsid protein
MVSIVRAVKAVWNSITGGWNSWNKTSSSANGAYFATDRRRVIINNNDGVDGTSIQTTSANLEELIKLSRTFERNRAVARAACEGFKADVIGSGIGILPTTENEDVNIELQKKFNEWAETAGVNGESLWSLQWLAGAEIFVAGASLWRIIVDINKEIPISILALEIEWLSTEPIKPIKKSNSFVKGIELDEFLRPVQYHLRNPMTMQGEVVDAKWIIHCYEKRRAMQVNGEPMLTPVLERIKQDDDLVTIELQSSKPANAVSLLVTTMSSPGKLGSKNYKTIDTSERETTVEPGTITYLMPDEKVEVAQTTRPNMNVATFRGTLRGDIAGACRVSQMWLDRDSSRSNYSASRMDQLMENVLTRPLKEMFGKQIAGKVYELVFPYIAPYLGIKDMSLASKYALQPDMPDYVNPKEDIEASVLAIENNLSTIEDELSRRGKRTFKEIVNKRASEVKVLKGLGLLNNDMVEYSKDDKKDSKEAEQGTENTKEGEEEADNKG